jgi:hypothetical protein
MSPEVLEREANKLLNEKYVPGASDAVASGTGTGTGKQNLNKIQQNWELVAHDRLQMMEQLRDEMHAWNEAYLKEKERGDRLESYLLKTVGINHEEVKHVVTSNNGVKRRSGFFQQRAAIERLYAPVASCFASPIEVERNEVEREEVEITE